MATVNRVYILIAFILSAIASIFNLVSIGTEEWITGSIVGQNGTGDVNDVHYGLFQGTYKRFIAFPNTYELTSQCSVHPNKELSSEECILCSSDMQFQTQYMRAALRAGCRRTRDLTRQFIHQHLRP